MYLPLVVFYVHDLLLKKRKKIFGHDVIVVTPISNKQKTTTL